MVKLDLFYIQHKYFMCKRLMYDVHVSTKKHTSHKSQPSGIHTESVGTINTETYLFFVVCANLMQTNKNIYLRIRIEQYTC